MPSLFAESEDNGCSGASGLTVRYSAVPFFGTKKRLMSMCSAGRLSAKNLSPSNQRPVSPIPSAANKMSPTGDSYF